MAHVANVTNFTGIQPNQTMAHIASSQRAEVTGKSVGPSGNGWVGSATYLPAF